MKDWRRGLWRIQLRWGEALDGEANQGIESPEQGSTPTKHKGSSTTMNDPKQRTCPGNNSSTNAIPEIRFKNTLSAAAKEELAPRHWLPVARRTARTGSLPTHHSLLVPRRHNTTMRMPSLLRLAPTLRLCRSGRHPHRRLPRPCDSLVGTPVGACPGCCDSGRHPHRRLPRTLRLCRPSRHPHRRLPGTLRLSGQHPRRRLPRMLRLWSAPP